MKEEKMLEFIKESVDKMVEYGNTPYAIICSRKIFGIVAKAIRKLGRFRELDNITPEKMWFKYNFGDVPVIKYRYCPKDIVYIVDKDTYRLIMEEDVCPQFAGGKK